MTYYRVDAGVFSNAFVRLAQTHIFLQRCVEDLLFEELNPKK